MKRIPHCLLASLWLVACAGAGCSKKEQAEVAPPTPAAGESTAEIANAEEAKVVEQDIAQAVPLDQASAAVEAGNYEAAAAAMVRAQYGATLTEEQRAQIAAAQQQLLNAGAKNAAAMEAYRGMSRAMNGR